MYTGLLHLHSFMRWVALLLIVISIFKFFGGMSSNRTFTSGDKKLGLFTLIAFHLQLVIGLILYFYMDWHTRLGEMADGYARFYSMEHILGMIIAIAFVTIGYSSAKKATVDKKKFKRLAWWFLASLIIVLVMIPWPFREVGVGRGWF